MLHRNSPTSLVGICSSWRPSQLNSSDTFRSSGSTSASLCLITFQLFVSRHFLNHAPFRFSGIRRLVGNYSFNTSFCCLDLDSTLLNPDLMFQSSANRMHHCRYLPTRNWHDMFADSLEKSNARTIRNVYDLHWMIENSIELFRFDDIFQFCCQ